MQYKSVLFGLALFGLLPGCTVNLNVNDTQLLGSERSERDSITNVLMAQQDAWNAGDIDAFMAGYWQSPDLRFASGGSVTRGWQATRDRYHARYSDRSIMGLLSFDQLEVVELSDDAAIVHGAWLLTRENDAPSGLFTLVFRKIDGAWLIVGDTTTSAD